MAQTVELVNIDLTSVQQGIDSTTQSIVELEEAQKKLRQESKKTDDQLAQEGKSRSNISRQMAENQVQLSELRRERTNNIRLLNSENKSLDQLRARQKQLRQELGRTTTATEEGARRFAEISDELASVTDDINEMQGGAASLSESLAQLNESSQQNSESLASMADSLSNASGAGGGLIDSLKGFLKNPYVAVFAAISGAIAAIGNALSESRSNSVLMQKATTNFSSAVDVAKSSVRDWFERTKENAKEHGTFKTVLKEYLGALTGVSVAQGIASKQNREQFNTLRNLKKELIDLNDAYIDIENELQTQIATQSGLSQAQAAIADDATRSLQERRESAQNAFNLEEKALQANITLANERLAISEKEIEIGIAAKDLAREADGSIKSLTKDGIELEKTYNEASIAAIQATNELTTARIENQKRIREINQDDFEQELDFLLDIADAQKTVNEQQIADQRISLEERKKILGETNSLVEESFNDQVSLFEREYGVQLERNKIADLNNKQIFEYARGLKLSEIATNRLREVIIERRKAVNDLNMAERDLNEEEITRRQEALRKVSEFNEQQIINEAESLEAQRDLRIAFETDEYENKISNKLLIDEELQALEVDHTQALKDINDKYRAEQEKADEKAAKKRSDIFKSVQDFASRTFNDLFSFISETQEASLEIQLANAQGNEEKQEKIRRDFAKKKKRSAISQAFANAALAVIKAFSELGPIAGAIASAFVIATTGAQISRIRAQEFKDGGEVTSGIFRGPSHSAGGIDLFAGNQKIANVEGNEGFFVVNKHDTPEAVSALSAINSKHGKPFAPRSYMQDGGEAALNQPGGITFEQALALAEARPLQVSVVDITDEQAIQTQVVNNGTI